MPISRKKIEPSVCKIELLKLTYEEHIVPYTSLFEKHNSKVSTLFSLSFKSELSVCPSQEDFWTCPNQGDFGRGVTSLKEDSYVCCKL